MTNAKGCRKYLTALSLLNGDLQYRVALLDEKCYEMKCCLDYCMNTWEEWSKELKKQQILNEIKWKEEEIAIEAENTLQQALQRARAIRQAQEIDGQRKFECKIKENISTEVNGNESTQKTARCCFPRQMIAKIKDEEELNLLWTSKESPTSIFQAKLNEIHTRQDSNTTRCKISYREQLFRLQHAFQRILQILTEKCAAYSADTPPSVGKVFPIWFRLHKIKKLLEELNQELASIVQRIPPPPQLTPEVAHRSGQFLRSIRRPERTEIDNERISQLYPLNDERNDVSILNTLQDAWNANEYVEAVDDILLVAIQQSLIKVMRSIVKSKVSTDDVDEMMLARLVHSITCCNGIVLRSFVSKEME